MRIGIFSPQLNAFGGGEKYVFKIAEILSRDHFTEIITLENINKKKIENGLNVNLEKVHFKEINLRKLNISTLDLMTKNVLIKNMSNKYDIFINQENDTIIPAKSNKNFYICQYPPFNSGKTFFEKLTEYFQKLTKSYFYDYQLNSYSKIVVYSQFVKKEMEKQFNNEITVLNPPIETFKASKKENIILSVGRFFVKGHNKKQLEMIKIFKQLYDENSVLKSWKYHLIGGIRNATEYVNYLEACKKEADGYPIYIHTNTPFKTLKEYYGKSKIFWHSTGLNEDENTHPELMEHFGITTGEAMSAGCVPVVINKGGQPEIVREKIDGFLWDTQDQLKKYTLKLVNDSILWKKMSLNAMKRAKKFEIEDFSNSVKELFINN